MRRAVLFASLLFLPVVALAGDPVPDAAQHRLKHGWVISDSESGALVILHTANGGKKWRVQVDGGPWAGHNANDISAVDNHTAWAALGAADSGKILHTRNGGKKWTEQALPAGVGAIKCVKGLSRRVAWAVALDGTVLHTTDGGEVWTVVPHPSAPVHGDVNRMDALGLPSADVWTVDEGGGRWGMIHSPDSGATWRNEYVPYENPQSQGVHMVSGVSPLVAWCAGWGEGNLFRTSDGGESWERAATVGGSDDIDDLCAATADTAWGVLNYSGGSGGEIFHVRLQGGQAVVDDFHPDTRYKYEGITCSDDQNVVAVGSRAVGVDPSLPRGIIVSTRDGGQTWTTQPLPVTDVGFWKVSFAGARR
jgi:photosystem II stability/assembly factor-like uncharacterized protein